MVNNNLKYLVISVFVIFGVWFVLAATNPGSLLFEQNATTDYDEGDFTLNWTEGANTAVNYSVYLYTGGAFFLKVGNDSDTGYTFSNTTEANYTFIVEGENATGTKTNSTTNISMYVDRTAPVITLPSYTNGTLKRNTDTLTLNISVIDAFSGEVGSVCLVDVKGTNESVAVSNRWCNSTSFNLTGLTDGNKTIKVYVNDTVNILGLNNSYVVKIDTTAPTISLTLSASARDSLTITVSGVEGTCTPDRSGASISGSTLTETGLVCGIYYSYTVTCTDSAGNAGASSATSFVTDGCGGGSPTPRFWTNTYIVSEEELEQGYRKELGVKNRVRVRVGVENHHVGVKSLTETQVTIEVSSDPVEIVLGVGEDTKVDVTGDGFYDIYVILNRISGDKADMTIQKIHEEVPEELKGEGAVEEGEGTAPPSRNLAWLWVVVAILILVLIGWGMKKKSR